MIGPRAAQRPGLIAAVGCLLFGAVAVSGVPAQPLVEAAPAPGLLPDTSAPFLGWEEAWPSRWNRGDLRIQGVVRTLEVKVTTLSPRRLRDVLTPDDEDRLDFRALAADRDDAGIKAAFEGPNSVVFEPVSGARRRGIGTGPGPDAGPSPSLVFRYVSGEARTSGGGGPQVVEVQRTWFALYEPVGQMVEGARGPAPQARATALLLPGIFGNPEPTIDGLILRLRQRGWAVLRMLCQPSRFTERVAFVLDTADLPAGAAAIARQFDNRTAECAYAAEGAWEFVEASRPGLRGLPCVAIGMSGGAITLPAVVAREPGRYSGAVLIAGAADYWLTSQRSNYREIIGALSVLWRGTSPDDDQQREFDRLYLERARLDAFHTAGALKGKRVLVIQGLADLAVPSALGDVLWERLGRPERWTYPLGHELLFAGLPAEFPRLVAWLEGVADGQGRPAADPAPGGAP